MIQNDSLKALIGGLGDPLRDKAAGVYYDFPYITDFELLNMYRGSWLPRKIVNIPAADSVREWRAWNAEAEEITAIENEEKRLGLRQKVMEAQIKARLWGGSLIYIGTGPVSDPMRPLEKVGRGGIRYLTVMNRADVSIREIDYDPESQFFNQPKAYTIGAKDYHPSRFIRFIGADLPDYRRFQMPGAGGWGDSVLLSMLLAIRNMDSTVANVASLVFEANVDVFGIPDFLSQIGTAAYRNQMLERVSLVAMNKGINRSILMDAAETFERKAISFADLPELIEKFMQNVSGACDIPATRLIGMSPAGMSSTGDSDMRNYYDFVKAGQTLELTPRLGAFDELLKQSAGMSADLWYEWVPLWQLSAKEKADIGKITAETSASLVNSGLVQPEALARSTVNALTEHGVFPGLESEVAELPEIDFEAEAEAEAEAAAAARAPVVRDMAPKPLYVSRKVKNAKEIIAWAKSAGFTDLNDASDLHVTIVYSNAPLDWFTIGESWTAEMKIPAGGPRVVERFGTHIVLRFKSSELEWRRDAILRAGASADFPEYKPHITIKKEMPGSGGDVESIPAYIGEIVLGPEIFETIK